MGHCTSVQTFYHVAVLQKEMFLCFLFGHIACGMLFRAACVTRESYVIEIIEKLFKKGAVCVLCTLLVSLRASCVTTQGWRMCVGWNLLFDCGCYFVICLTSCFSKLLCSRSQFFTIRGRTKLLMPAQHGVKMWRRTSPVDCPDECTTLL
jgi:hypothetical protein